MYKKTGRPPGRPAMAKAEKKQQTTVVFSPEVIARGRELGINISRAAERGLLQAIRDAEQGGAK